MVFSLAVRSPAPLASIDVLRVAKRGGAHLRARVGRSHARPPRQALAHELVRRLWRRSGRLARLLSRHPGSVLKGSPRGVSVGSTTDPSAGVVTAVLKGTASMSRRPTFGALALSPLALVAILLMVVALVTHDAAASTPPLFLPAVNHSTGGLDTIFPNSGGPVWIAAADVNGDGALDILVANWCVTPQECTRSNVGVLMNAGHGTFRPAVTYDTGGYHAFSVSVADVNADGKGDLVVENGCGDAVTQQTSSVAEGAI